MTCAETKPPPQPRRNEVAHYLSDMAVQLAAMAKGVGLSGVAEDFLRAHESCEAALDKRD